MLITTEDKKKYLQVVGAELELSINLPPLAQFKKWAVMKELELAIIYDCLTNEEICWLEKKVFELEV